MKADRSIRVAVVEDSEVISRGLAALLADDPILDVSEVQPEDVAAGDFDVAVVSRQAAATHTFECPIVIAGEESRGSDGLAPDNRVGGFFHSGSMTAAQLHATVQAAAAGLEVNPPEAGEALDPRSVQVLELIAGGHSTREIADRLSYSERTIKKLVTQLEEMLDARSRAQVVAEAIRRGLI